MRTILVVTNIPTPYRIPLFNEIARQFRAEGNRLFVVFGAWGYRRRRWEIDPESFEFEYHVLPGGGFYIGKSESITLTYRGLIRLIRATKPHFVITSGYSIASVKIWFCNLVLGTPYGMWSGAVRGVGASRSVLRGFIRRRLVGRAASFIAYGTRAKEYLASLGADERRIFTAINTVDVAFFKAAAQRQQSSHGEEHRKVILYVGNLTRGKRLDLALMALAEIQDKAGDFVFRLVGDGDERANLEALAKDIGIENRVEFAGFKQRDEVAAEFAGATCFVFPSEYDVWGLVLVEAMAAGVPCVASIRAGATVDLIDDGQTGYAVDFDDIGRVAAHIATLLTDTETATRIGKAGRNFIDTHCNLTVSAKGFSEAVVDLPSEDRQGHA